MSIQQPDSAGAYESWIVRKPAVESTRGLVASHHYRASALGARVLEAGGNAVDAAVTAGFAIGAVEPWMSGLGGGGYMLVYQARERRAWCVDFGMVAPRALDPAAYALEAGATDDDLFGWPRVRGEHNVSGPLSVAVPGLPAGLALALERFGTLSLADALGPAIGLAETGLPADWYATLKIAAAAPVLARFPESARSYLPGGFVPAGEWAGPPPVIRLGRLAQTLRRLAEAGAGDFYRGEVAQALVADVREAGGVLSAEDLAAYEARVLPAASAPYRGGQVHVAPGLTAGPTLHRALALLESAAPSGQGPDAGSYVAYARALMRAYDERLRGMGDHEDARAPACTTHLTVVDAEGNMVALTQTLLSVFGSKLMLPATGVLMNNGIMWFDPRPGRSNSLAPGRRPLSNMCPVVAERADGLRMAAGASGGRRIVPAVFQLLSFVLDHHMELEAACHLGRIDVSGGDLVTAERSLPQPVLDALRAEFRLQTAQHGVYPALFACPNAVTHDPASGRQHGCAFVHSPWAEACAAGA